MSPAWHLLPGTRSAEKRGGTVVMKLRTIRFLAGAAVVCSIGWGAASVSAQVPVYLVRDLGTLGGRVTQPMDLNEAGQVTGYSETSDGQLHAFLYTEGEMRDLGAVASGGSAGRALNDAGLTTGLTAAADGFGHAFRYDPGTGAMSDIGAAGASSAGNDINNLGDVAGEAFDASGVRRAALFRNGAPVLDLGTPPGLSSSAASVNDTGQVVGTFDDSAGSHAFFFNGAAAAEIVPGRVSFVLGNQAINASGAAVGGFQADDGSHCFLYQGGQVTDPGSLGGGYCVGLGINNNGAITGLSAIANGERHAFAFSNGAMTDLGALSGGLSIGYAINDAGQVAGEASLAGGGSHAFVYTNGMLLDLALPIQLAAGLQLVSDSVAFDINSSGVVLGRFTVSNPLDPQMPSRTRAFVATPILGLLQALTNRVGGVGPGTSLADKLTSAQASLAAQNATEACSTLRAFSHELAAQSGKKVDSLLATDLQSDAGEIESAVGCGSGT
jgi:probable HAF family extracellular repeat protein